MFHDRGRAGTTIPTGLITLNQDVVKIATAARGTTVVKVAGIVTLLVAAEIAIEAMTTTKRTIDNEVAARMSAEKDRMAEIDNTNLVGVKTTNETGIGIAFEVQIQAEGGETMRAEMHADPTKMRSFHISHETVSGVVDVEFMAWFIQKKKKADLRLWS